MARPDALRPSAGRLARLMSAGVLVALAACGQGGSWKPIPIAAVADSLALRGQHLQVHSHRGTTRVLFSPHVLRDSLFGLDADSLDRGVNVDVSFALADIDSVAISHHSLSRTTGNVVGGTAIVFGALLLAAAIGLATGG